MSQVRRVAVSSKSTLAPFATVTVTRHSDGDGDDDVMMVVMMMV